MDENKKIIELKERVREFMTARDWRKFHSPKDLAVIINLEASELLEIFRFQNDEEQKETMKNKKQEISDELSDVLMNVLEFADMYDIDLSSSLEYKIKKAEEKYPIDKCKGKNKKYTEYK